MGFLFDEGSYAEKVRNLTTRELKQRELVKYRQRISNGAGAIGSAALTLPTTGASLVSAVIEGRLSYVANRKLRLIRAELQRRGVQLLEPSAMDIFIPLSLGAVVAGRDLLL
jgi:hypothetical protein